MNTLKQFPDELWAQLTKGLTSILGLEEKNYFITDKPYWSKEEYSHEMYIVFNNKSMGVFLNKNADIILYIEPNPASFYPEYNLLISDLGKWPKILDIIEKFFKIPFDDKIDDSEDKLFLNNICEKGLFHKDYGQNTHLDHILDSDKGKREYLIERFPWLKEEYHW